jgi:hypothetical protein
MGRYAEEKQGADPSRLTSVLHVRVMAVWSTPIG